MIDDTRPEMVARRMIVAVIVMDENRYVGLEKYGLTWQLRGCYLIGTDSHIGLHAEDSKEDTMGWLLWVRLFILLLLGVLGAASVIVKTRPDAKELIDKLVKFSGVIGVLAVIWGAWDLISALRFMSILGSVPVTWFMWLVTCAVQIALGFVFGWGMVTSHLNEQTARKGEEFRKKLVRYQVVLGWSSFALAFWWVLVLTGIMQI